MSEKSQLLRDIAKTRSAIEATEQSVGMTRGAVEDATAMALAVDKDVLNLVERLAKLLPDSLDEVGVVRHVTRVCRSCGKSWAPVRRGECVQCGSDGGSIEASEFLAGY